jgi:hypothetical protein
MYDAMHTVDETHVQPLVVWPVVAVIGLVVY